MVSLTAFVCQVKNEIILIHFIIAKLIFHTDYSVPWDLLNRSQMKTLGNFDNLQGLLIELLAMSHWKKKGYDGSGRRLTFLLNRSLLSTKIKSGFLF